MIGDLHIKVLGCLFREGDLTASKLTLLVGASRDSVGVTLRRLREHGFIEIHEPWKHRPVYGLSVAGMERVVELRNFLR